MIFSSLVDDVRTTEYCATALSGPMNRFPNVPKASWLECSSRPKQSRQAELVQRGWNIVSRSDLRRVLIAAVAFASLASSQSALAVCYPEGTRSCTMPDGCQGTTYCDGQFLSPCERKVGSTRSCAGCGTGGRQACPIGGGYGTCQPVSAGTEVCDSWSDCDEDKDGQVDEGETAPCGDGVCRRTVAMCAGGSPQTCTPDTSKIATEVCDSLDNDCDAAVDESLGDYSCGAGPCARTAPNCVAGQWQTTCQPDTASASSEICDGVDNDCDGTLDEGLGQTTCGIGQCQNTVWNCAGGQSQDCEPLAGSTETCDGLDNDCDGNIDQGTVCRDENQTCTCVPLTVAVACGSECGTERPDGCGGQITCASCP